MIQGFSPNNLMQCSDVPCFSLAFRGTFPCQFCGISLDRAAGQVFLLNIYWSQFPAEQVKLMQMENQVLLYCKYCYSTYMNIRGPSQCAANS